jgi:transcriptional regulator with XRE-family HTH domain
VHRVSKPAQQPSTLGQVVRARRRSFGLTLVQLAGLSGLSQPFLSQIERGSAQPSMKSLAAIAEALQTTGPALLAAPRGDDAPVVAAGQGEQIETAPGGTARLLASGPHDLLPMEFIGGPTEFDEYLQHEGHEFVYVVSGLIELDLGGDLRRLGPRDSAHFEASTPHRWRVAGDEQVWMLAVANAPH